jgi:hypothetical protein
MLCKLGIATALATAFLHLCPAQAQTRTTDSATLAPEMRLAGERITLPIVMVKGFPFVEGSIAGVSGKLLLDTGADEAFVVNSHRVPVSNTVPAGRGKFGSGQTYDVATAPRVEDVRVAELRYPGVTRVNTQDATQLERITPDFIGWLGYYFWENYALELDYGRLQATFHRQPGQDYLAGQKQLAALPFDLLKRRNIPIMKARIGDTDLTVAFDSGQYGYLYVDPDVRDKMIRQGLLAPAGEDGSYKVTQMRLAGVDMASAMTIKVDTAPFPAAAPIGVPEKNFMTIGYGFLRDHRTVWDFQKKTIYVLGER